MNSTFSKKQFLITSILSLFGIILVLYSCHEGTSAEVGDPFDTLTCLELNDPVLEREIIEYDKATKKRRGSNPYILTLYSKTLNDSVQRYVIGSTISTQYMTDSPYSFPFKVAGKPVLYYSQEMGNVFFNDKIFRLKESTRVAIMRKYFPEEYKEWCRSLKVRDGMKRYVAYTYDPVLCYLTFCKGKIVGKTMKGGCYTDRVPYTINGKEYDGIDDAGRFICTYADLTDTLDHARSIIHEPAFPGGKTKMLKFIKQNQRYPQKAKTDNIQGRVILTFDIEKNGKLSNIEVTDSVHPMLDKEAVRIIESMPNWKPATRDWKRVKAKYIIPIYFKM